MSFRKRLEQGWFTILLLTLIGLGVSRIFQKEDSRIARREIFERRLQNFPTESTSAQAKKVTRSLIQLENTQQPSDHVLFFNRVPKTGSEMLVLLLQWLQGQNGFRHVRLPGGRTRKLTLTQQEKLVEEITTITRREAVPVSFDRHVYFTNFTEFGRQLPIYVNLVRDPVDKAVSRFYYGQVTPNPLNPDIKFKISKSTPITKFGSYEHCVKNKDAECTFIDGQSYDLAIPYFCGHNTQCMSLNDRYALAKAKENVDAYYPVVGVLEELNATLAVLEKKLPLFFRGVTDMYFHDLLEPHKNANRMRPRKIDMYIRSHLKRRLSAEYDFYYWLKARLIKQANNKM